MAILIVTKHGYLEHLRVPVATLEVLMSRLNMAPLYIVIHYVTVMTYEEHYAEGIHAQVTL